MKRGLDWYKREPASMLDAIRAARMTDTQAAVYNVVLDLIYLTAGETPNDPRFIAAHFSNIGAAKARRTIDELIEMGKLDVVGDMLHQKRAENEAETRKNLREIRADAGRLGGVRSGISRRKSNEINETGEAIASTKPEPEKRREEKIGGGGGSDAEHDAILIAAGVDPTKDVTGKWFGLSAQHEVASWRALGLTQSEIIDVVRDVRRGGRHPPSTLSYFRQPMQRAAGLKVAAPLDPIPPSDQATGGSRHGRQPDSLDRTQRVIAGAAARARAREARMAGWQDQDPARPLLPAGPVDPGGGGGSG